MKVLDQTVTNRFALYHGDSCEVLRGLPARSVDYAAFSPPFGSLYTYSNSPRDLGNVRNYADFEKHFGYIVDGIARVMRPGRNVSVHCMDLPTSKAMHGHVGLFDFRGELIRAFEHRGFVWHSSVVIWKDPVTAMQRTKALGLLHKTLRENGTMSRQGIPDYLVTFRALGDVEHRVMHDPEQYPVSTWQSWASPVWDDLEADAARAPMPEGPFELEPLPVWRDIDPSDTLQRESAREHDDERHIAPLQLEVVRRGVLLWSNPGDVVLSPFAGIGSEGYVALKEGRRFVGCELKRSYYEQAAKNLAAACGSKQRSMFEASP